MIFPWRTAWELLAKPIGEESVRENESYKYLSRLLQVDPEKRMTIGEAMDKMKKFGNFLRLTEKFESFENLTNIDISQNTQHSIDMTNLENLSNLTKSSDVYSDRRTYFHGQRESQLCHSFAIVSALRQALLMLLKNPACTLLPTIENEIRNPNGRYSFRIFFVNFLGNVNPRSYQGPELKHFVKCDL